MSLGLGWDEVEDGQWGGLGLLWESHYRVKMGTVHLLKNQILSDMLPDVRFYSYPFL